MYVITNSKLFKATLLITFKMMDFFYHNAIGAFIAISSFVTLEYISDPQNFFSNLREYISRAQYWSIDKVVSLYTLYNDIQKRINPPKQVNDSDPIFSYDDDGNLNPDNDVPSRIYKKMVKDGKTYYVDYSILTNDVPVGSSGTYSTNFSPIEDVFIDINLDHNGVTYNIKRHLEKFAIVGHVLEGHFFKAFMKRFFNVDNVTEYTISGIDNAFNNVTYNEDDVIRITEHGHASGYVVNLIDGDNIESDTPNESEDEQDVDTNTHSSDNDYDTDDIGNTTEDDT